MLVGGERRPPSLGRSLLAEPLLHARACSCRAPWQQCTQPKRHALSARRPGRAARPPASPPSPAPTASAAHAQARRTRLRTARVALAWSCRCTLWRRWCNAPGQWARRAAGAPLATRCASCSGAVDAAGGGESTAGGLAWPPFASVPGTSADLAGCSLDQQRVGSARCAVRRPTRRTCSGVPACAVCGAHNAAVGNRRSGSAPVAEVGRALLRDRQTS